MSVYVAWPRVHPVAVDAYARRCLLNALIDHRRSAFARRERAHAELPEIDGVDPGRIDMQPTVFRALGRLPPRMRAAVVLRHLLDLSVEESAAALRCSTGTASRLVPASAGVRHTDCHGLRSHPAGGRAPPPASQ